MANIQYIGARYVPIIYTNPDDGSSNWKGGVSYEALTVVTYLDDSYTSRKPVPGSIGDPASNPSYWAKTGNFNAAMTQMQNAINDLENSLDFTNSYIKGQRFSDRHFAFQSDSYLTLCDKIIENMGLGLNDCTRIGSSGGGFVQQGSDGHTFYDDLLEVSVDDTITDFIIIGGENDAINNISAPDVSNAMDSYFSLAKNRFPNARIYFIPCQHLTDTVQHCRHYINDLFVVFRKRCAIWGIRFFENAPYIANTLNLISGDRQHYSASTGVDFASLYIINALAGSDINIAREETMTGSVVGINGSTSCRIITNNSMTELNILVGTGNGAFAFDTAKTINDIKGVRTTIANYSNLGGNIVNGFAFRSMIPIFIYTTNGSKIMTDAMCELRTGGDITLFFYTNLDAYAGETIDYLQLPTGIKLTDCTYYLA